MASGTKTRKPRRGADPGPAAEVFPTEMASVAGLRPHPRNYRTHNDEQVAELVHSLRQHGFYRNVVVARDGTILAGHGVVLAARSMGLTEIPVVRLDLDPESPVALKVLTGDNEIAHMVENDDRLLTELLREIKDHAEDGLAGTGYDDAMLANLVFVTRPQSEIRTHDAAAEWVGMPEYTPGETTLKASISFRNEDDRREFAEKLGIPYTTRSETLTGWYPPKERDDLASVRFEG